MFYLLAVADRERILFYPAEQKNIIKAAAIDAL
jgi:hypothetical protein